MVSFDFQKFDSSENKELNNFNNYLADYAYVNGYNVSSSDVNVFEKFQSAPSVSKYPHIARWYQNISSYESSEQSS